MITNIPLLLLRLKKYNVLLLLLRQTSILPITIYDRPTYYYSYSPPPHNVSNLSELVRTSTVAMCFLIRELNQT